MIVELEDSLFFGENPDVNIYVSPPVLSNHYRSATNTLRVSSLKFLKSNFTVLTNTAKQLNVPINSIMTVPQNVLIKK